MKKLKLIIIIIVLCVIVTSLAITTNRRITIKMKMGIWIPFNSEILNYERNYGYFYNYRLLAKISMSKDDYEALYLDISKFCEKSLFADDISELVNELDEGHSFVYAEDSYLPINIEKGDPEWWDLEIENIDEMHYIEKENYRIGIRDRWIRRIYVVYTDSDVILYLSLWK